MRKIDRWVGLVVEGMSPAERQALTSEARAHTPASALLELASRAGLGDSKAAQVLAPIVLESPPPSFQEPEQDTLYARIGTRISYTARLKTDPEGSIDWTLPTDPEAPRGLLKTRAWRLPLAEIIAVKRLSAGSGVAVARIVEATLSEAQG